jgi:hypothetical protein
LRYKIIEAAKKLKIGPSSPRTNHTCHQKPNPSREIAPLTFKYSRYFKAKPVTYMFADPDPNENCHPLTDRA